VVILLVVILLVVINVVISAVCQDFTQVRVVAQAPAAANVGTQDPEPKRPANQSVNPLTIPQSYMARATSRALKVVQCDQTSVLATSIMYR
jgi:hypothetical protein